MTFQEAIRHLDRGVFAPVYLITGEESFLVDQLRRHFLEKGLSPSAKGFNLHQFRGEETAADIILSVAQTFPIASPRRMVFVQNTEQLKDDRGLLLDYLAHPLETTVLVFVAEKPDMRKKLFMMLKKKGICFTCPRPREQELPGWIKQEAKKRGLSLSEETIWFLKEHLGRNLLAIHQELEKLMLYQSSEEGSQNPVPVDIVQKMVSGGRTHSIFELTKAVGNKEGETAVVLLNKMLAEGAHPLFILSMLVRLFRQMALAKDLIDTGQSAAVAKKVPMPPSLMPLFLRQVKKWSQPEIYRAFSLSLSADSQLKGGGLSERSIMETLLLDLCSGHQFTRERIQYSRSFLAQDRA